MRSLQRRLGADCLDQKDDYCLTALWFVVATREVQRQKIIDPRESDLTSKLLRVCSVKHYGWAIQNVGLQSGWQGEGAFGNRS